MIAIRPLSSSHSTVRLIPLGKSALTFDAEHGLPNRTLFLGKPPPSEFDSGAIWTGTNAETKGNGRSALAFFIHL
jgi:hypothetical protein